MTKGGKKERGWLASGRRAVCLCLIVSFLVLAVQPITAKKAGALTTLELFILACGGATPCLVFDVAAYGAEIAQLLADRKYFIIQANLYKTIFTAWLVANATILAYMGEAIPSAIETSDAMKPSGNRLLAEALPRLANARADSELENKYLEAQARIVAQNVPPEETEQFLCNNIVACQAPLAMGDFAKMVSKMVADGISMRYRQKGDDGDGPQAASDEEQGRCGDNAAGAGFANADDGYSDRCAALSVSSLTSLADADISAGTLDLDQALQMPSMTQKTESTAYGDVKVNVPDMEAGANSPRDLAEKRAWIAAVSQCAKIAGPRPTPPLGSDLDNPEQMVKRAQWNHCAAMQDEFVKRCADRVGMLSRPDCGNDDFQTLCEVSVHGCNAARDADMDLPPNIRNCAAGVNLYQASELCNKMCASSRQFQAKANVGTSHAQMISDAALCDLSERMWKKRMDAEKAAFLKAVANMEGLKDCWPK